MLAFAGVILYVPFCIVLASDEAKEISCSPGEEGEYAVPPYEFLEEGAELHIVMTSLREVFTLPDNTPITCIIAITSGKNNDTFEFLGTVYYNYGNSETSQTWEPFSQSFRLEGESGKYYRMNITEVNGAPSAVYEFAYTTRNCAVMTVKEFKYRVAENTKPSERSSSNAEVSDASQGSRPTGHTDEDENDGKAHCIMLTKGGNVKALQNFCEPYYNQCCKKKNSDYAYQPGKCKIPKKYEEL